MKTIWLEETDSTNVYAKTLLSLGEDAIVVAKKQTGGRGTKGRAFSSEEGGVYLTKLSFYRDFPAKNAFLVMARAATAVCETLEAFGLNPKIKWANDVFVNDRKICGILIENVLSGSNVSASVVGIGINVDNALPNELKTIATSMSEELKKTIDVRSVTDTLIERLQKESPVSEYRRRVGYLNRSVALIEGGKRRLVYASDVTDCGELVVKDGGTIKKIQAGEVSLHYDFNE